MIRGYWIIHASSQVSVVRSAAGECSMRVKNKLRRSWRGGDNYALEGIGVNVVSFESKKQVKDKLERRRSALVRTEVSVVC